MENQLLLTAPDYVEIEIPDFPGYYESILSDGIDREEEQHCEYEANERQNENGIPEELHLSESEYAEILFNHTDYSQCYLSVTHTYVDAFDSLCDEYLGFEIGSIFAGQESPREYNFSTNRVFIKVPASIPARLMEICKEDEYCELERILEERCTSYDGFCSFYSNEISEFLAKGIGDLDHNELSLLLMAALAVKGYDTRDPDLDLYYRVTDCDSLYHEWESGVDWPAVDKKIDEYRDLKIAELQDENPDFVPAYRCMDTVELPLN